MIGGAFLLAAAGLCVGCRGFDVTGGRPPVDRPMKVWVASDMAGLTDRTQPAEDPDLFDSRKRAISLFAAANETVSFQVVLDADLNGMENVAFAWTDLAGPGGAKIPASRVRAFRMLPLQVREYPPWYLRLVEAVPEPAGVYDPLVPIGASGEGESFKVGPNGRLALWIDLTVPRDATGGEYRGALRVSAGGHTDWRAELKLQVYSFVLPDTRPVPAVGGFDHRELFGAFLSRDGKPFDPVYLDRSNPMVRKGLVLMRELMRMAHEHRLDLFDTRIRPIMKRTGEGEVTLQWQDYDAIVAPYLDGTAFSDRIGGAAWPMPLSHDWPNPEFYGGRSSELYARTVKSLLASCRDHFAKDARTGKRMFIWPCRNPEGPDGYGVHGRLARLAREVDPNTPILCQLPTRAAAESGWQVPRDFSSLVDILAPPGQMLDANGAAAASSPAHPLKGVWLAPGTPPYVPSLGVVATPADVRAACWFAMKYGCTGLFLPDVLHWSKDPFAPVASGETRLFYPGAIARVDSPLPSVRLKRLRRGLQDLAYLWILRKRQRAGLAQAAMDSLVRYAGLAAAGDNYLDPRLDGWESDGKTWTLARRILAEEVQGIVNPDFAHRTASLAHRLAWKRLGEQTRSLKIEQVRTFVRAADGSTEVPPEKLHLTVLLDVFNQFGRRADLKIRLPRLPEEWKALSPADVEIQIQPGRRKTIRLEAVGPGPLPTEGNAKMPLPVHLTSNVQKDTQVDASVSFLRVGLAKTPPKIDGRLDDWPLRSGNTARDFRLLGRRGRLGDGLAKRQTMAFVLRDADRLYVAFRCEEPNIAGLTTRASNTVQSRQLMLTGEDLVEILLDPGAAASGPDGLFRLIVKPNGVLIAEKGIRSDPPLGPTDFWPVSATVAVAKAASAWSVEMAVPLAAFGPAGAEGLWRVNFTRYSVQGAEASGWSGVGRHFYDPRNLGTMFVGPGATTRE